MIRFIYSVKIASFRLTLVIEGFAFIILKTSIKDSFLKCCYWTNHVDILNLKSSKSTIFLGKYSRHKITCFAGAFCSDKSVLTSWVTMSVSSMTCWILGTFWCLVFSINLILDYVQNNMVICNFLPDLIKVFDTARPN